MRGKWGPAVKSVRVARPPMYSREILLHASPSGSERLCRLMLHQLLYTVHDMLHEEARRGGGRRTRAHRCLCLHAAIRQSQPSAQPVTVAMYVSQSYAQLGTLEMAREGHTHARIYPYAPACTRCYTSIPARVTRTHTHTHTHTHTVGLDCVAV